MSGEHYKQALYRGDLRIDCKPVDGTIRFHLFAHSEDEARSSALLHVSLRANLLAKESYFSFEAVAYGGDTWTCDAIRAEPETYGSDLLVRGGLYEIRRTNRGPEGNSPLNATSKSRKKPLEAACTGQLQPVLAAGRGEGGDATIPRQIGPVHLGRLGRWVTVRCPPEYSQLMRRAGGTWDYGSQRSLIHLRRIDPVLRVLRRVTDPLSRKLGMCLGGKPGLPPPLAGASERHEHEADPLFRQASIDLDG
jgi:hypothetical protein